MTVKTQKEFEEQITLLRLKRSGAEKIYRAFVAKEGLDALKPGQGKGKEPKPWCLCHNRNPCPIEAEIAGYGRAK